jgi:hypothetical protein
VLIFGFGPGKAQDLGEVAPTLCPFCHNSVFLHFIRSKKSVRLYFVPVVPYGTDEYLLCPVCTRGLQLSSEQSTSVGAMQGTTAAYREGRLAEPDYLARVSQFWAAIGVNPGGQQVLQTTAPEATVAAPTPPVAPPVNPTPPPVPAAAPTAGPETSWIEQLAELDHLHQQGVLSDERYEAAKRRVLGHDEPEPLSKPISPDD